MKVAKFTIKRGQVDHLIHTLKALAKLHDSPQKNRFVACQFLQMERPQNAVNKLLKRDPKFLVIIQIDTWESKANAKSLPKMPDGNKDKGLV